MLAFEPISSVEPWPHGIGNWPAVHPRINPRVFLVGGSRHCISLCPTFVYRLRLFMSILIFLVQQILFLCDLCESFAIVCDLKPELSALVGSLLLV